MHSMGFINKFKSVNNSWGYVTYLSDGSLGRIFGRIGPKNFIDNRSQELMITSGTLNGPLKKEIIFAAKDVLCARVLHATSDWVKYRIELNDGLVAIVAMTVMGLPTGKRNGNKTTRNANFNDGWLNFEAWLGEALERGNSLEVDFNTETKEKSESKSRYIHSGNFDNSTTMNDDRTELVNNDLIAKENNTDDKIESVISADKTGEKIVKEKQDSLTSIKPIFHDYDRDEELKKAEVKNEPEKERKKKPKSNVFPADDKNVKPSIPKAKMNKTNFNMQHVYFLGRRFGIEIDTLRSFDEIKEVLSNVKVMNNSDAVFIQKIMKCNSFDELFIIWDWFVKLYS